MNKDPLKAQKASFWSTWKHYLFCRLHLTAGFRKVLSLTSAQWEQISYFREKPTLLIVAIQVSSTISLSLRWSSLKQTDIQYEIHKT